MHVESHSHMDKASNEKVQKGTKRYINIDYKRHDTHNGWDNEFIVHNSVPVHIVIENSSLKKECRAWLENIH